MLKSVRSRAEEQFTATQKKDKQALKEKEKAWQEMSDRTANLRALRLAKEAADEEAAEKAAAEKAAEKAAAKKAAAKKAAAKNKKKPTRLPQAHRR